MLNLNIMGKGIKIILLLKHIPKKKLLTKWGLVTNNFFSQFKQVISIIFL